MKKSFFLIPLMCLLTNTSQGTGSPYLGSSPALGTDDGVISDINPSILADEINAFEPELLEHEEILSYNMSGFDDLKKEVEQLAEMVRPYSPTSAQNMSWLISEPRRIEMFLREFPRRLVDVRVDVGNEAFNMLGGSGMLDPYGVTDGDNYYMAFIGQFNDQCKKLQRIYDDIMDVNIFIDIDMDEIA